MEGGVSEQSDKIAEAVERHADLILKASGSALRNYTLPKNRKAILAAVLDLYEEAYRTGAKFVMDSKDTPPMTTCGKETEMMDEAALEFRPDYKGRFDEIVARFNRRNDPAAMLPELLSTFRPLMPKRG